MAIGKAVAAYLAGRQARQAQQEQRILKLHEDGVSIRAIAKTVHLAASEVAQIVESQRVEPSTAPPNDGQTKTVGIVIDERRRLVNVDDEHRRAALTVEISQRYLSGESLTTIADALNMTVGAVYGLLKKSGIPVRKRGRPRKFPELHTIVVTLTETPLLPTEDDAIRLYESGKTVEQVAAALQVTVGAVRRVITNRGISRGRGRPKHPPSERHFLIAEAYRSGKTMEAIGREYRITRERVRQLLAKVQEPSRPTGVSHTSPELVDQAVNLYRQGHSCRAVAELLGVAPLTVAKWFRVRGLQFRPKGKAPSPATRERDESMARLYRDGKRLVDIARTFRMAPQTAWTALRRLNVQPRSKPRPTR